MEEGRGSGGRGEWRSGQLLNHDDEGLSPNRARAPQGSEPGRRGALESARSLSGGPRLWRWARSGVRLGSSCPGCRAAFGEKDAVVIVAAPDGTTQWVDQLGTAEVDFATDVVVTDDGEIVVRGATLGELTEGTRFGAHDGFVRRYDALGSLVWSTPFGTGQHDVPRALALAPDGSAVVVGTTGPRVPFGYEDEADAFVAIFDEAGSQASWTTFGSRVLDAANDVVVSPSGEIYVVGLTMGCRHLQLGLATEGDRWLPELSDIICLPREVRARRRDRVGSPSERRPALRRRRT